jgi:hypothetical protein
MTTKRENPCSHLSNDADLVQDPHDCMCTEAWDKRSTPNQKACLKLFREIKQRVNVVYMIKINLKGPPVPDATHPTGRRWPHIMYPIEFQSLKDAHDWLSLSPDPALQPEGLRSWSYETVRKPMPEGFKLLEPRPRKDIDPDPTLQPRKKRRR